MVLAVQHVQGIHTDLLIVTQLVVVSTLDFFTKNVILTKFFHQRQLQRRRKHRLKHQQLNVQQHRRENQLPDEQQRQQQRVGLYQLVSRNSGQNLVIFLSKIFLSKKFFLLPIFE